VKRGKRQKYHSGNIRVKIPNSQPKKAGKKRQIMSTFDYQGALQSAAGDFRGFLQDNIGWQDVDSKNEAKLARKTIPNTTHTAK
jgi:hypothetical protein